MTATMACAELPDVELVLPDDASSTTVARRVVRGLVEALDMSPGLRVDVQLAVSEVVTNAVLHAAGPIVLRAGARDDHLEIIVRDRGLGMRPRGPATGLGLGLSLAAALSDTFQIRRRAGGGTEALLQFTYSGRATPLEPG